MARTTKSTTRKTTTKTTAAKEAAKPAAKGAAKASAPAKAGASRPRAAAKGSSPSSVVMTVTHDDIARRAYEIWEAKGRPAGQEEQNWREAEASLRGGQA